MKKKIITALLAGVLATASVVPASASEVSDVTPENSTTVTANIVDSGSVSYTISIPQSVDFGTLEMPEDNSTAHYAFSSFSVTATNLNIQSNQAVSVYVKNSASTETDNNFYISKQDASDSFMIEYDVYNTAVDSGNINTSTPINGGEPNTHGYHFYSFKSQGAEQKGTLVLNQNALYGKNLSDIAGDYSGTMTFFSALVQTN